MRRSPAAPVTSRTHATMAIRPWTCSGSSQSILEPRASILTEDTIAHILLIFFLVFLGCLTGVDAVNLIQCGARLRDAQAAAGNTTNSTSSVPTLHLTYEQCINECGGGTGDVNWDAFSQSFGAWFLPWIALMFQIPFGSECMWHLNISLPF